MDASTFKLRRYFCIGFAAVEHFFNKISIHGLGGTDGRATCSPIGGRSVSSGSTHLSYTITFAHAPVLMSDVEVSKTSRKDCCEVLYQLRVYQYNIAKIFNLVPDTILLVSTDGTVALPNELVRFSDIDECDEWVVEGLESSKRTSGSSMLMVRNSISPGPSGRNGGGLPKWKPFFSGRRGNTNTNNVPSSSNFSVSPYGYIMRLSELLVMLYTFR